LRLLPAPSGTGILFRRTDLDGSRSSPRAQRRQSQLRTSLMKKGVLISTTEHLLSALVAWA